MDWSEIKSLTQYEAENLVMEYWINKGFCAIKIDENSVTEGHKVPDLEISKNNEKYCLVEIKTPEHNLNPVTKMYHWNTTFNKIRSYTRTAVKQFGDYDPEHKSPWILAITSNHPQLNWTHYASRINNAIVLGGSIIRDFNPSGQERKIDADVLEIDMAIWFQINYLDRKSVVDLKFFINNDSQYKKQVETLADALSKPLQTGKTLN